MSDEVHPEAQECALIVSQEGRPQQVPTNFPGMNEELSVLVGSHHSVGDDPDPLVCLVHPMFLMPPFPPAPPVYTGRPSFPAGRR